MEILLSITSDHVILEKRTEVIKDLEIPNRDEFLGQ
jgi:hypothetical protein